MNVIMNTADDSTLQQRGVEYCNSLLRHGADVRHRLLVNKWTKAEPKVLCNVPHLISCSCQHQHTTEYTHVHWRELSHTAMYSTTTII